MKHKIQEALSNKYKNLGFDDKAFEGVADFAQTLIKEEAEIAPFVDGASSMLKVFQSSADKLRTEKAQIEKEKNELMLKLKALEEANPSDTPTDAPPDDTPIWAKKFMEDNIALRKEIEGIKQGEATKSILEQAKAQFFTADLNPARKNFAEIAFREKTTNITNETKLDDVLTNIKTFYNDLCSGDSDKGYLPKDSTGGKPEVVDWSATRARLQASGRLPKEKTD